MNASQELANEIESGEFDYANTSRRRDLVAALRTTCKDHLQVGDASPGTPDREALREVIAGEPVCAACGYPRKERQVLWQIPQVDALLTCANEYRRLLQDTVCRLGPHSTAALQLKALEEAIENIETPL